MNFSDFISGIYIKNQLTFTKPYDCNNNCKRENQGENEISGHQYSKLKRKTIKLVFDIKKKSNGVLMFRFICFI